MSYANTTYKATSLNRVNQNHYAPNTQLPARRVVTTFVADLALTPPELKGGILVHDTDANNRNITLPDGDEMDASFGVDVPKDGDMYSFGVVETNAANTSTLVAGTGFTIVGEAVVAAQTGAKVECVRTAADTWVAYVVASA